MKTSDFFFDLPPRLIAQYPARRGQSRLMVLNRRTKKTAHRVISDLPKLLSDPVLWGGSGPPLLVFNNSKVRKARLSGISLKSGRRAEFLLLEREGSRWKALVQKAKQGGRYGFFDEKGAETAQAEIIEEKGEFRVIEFDRPIDDDWLDRYGHIPLPPYIRRPDTGEDADRYQTVYADVRGSAAAPTAGLHFTRELMERLALSGIECLFITLHVGMGTFLPVRAENIEEHFMHEESFFIDENTAAKIEKAKAEGRKIAAVGTTSLRALESAWQENSGLKAGEGSTAIFIYPGFEFKLVDILLTNFHTPESTLLMLVSAFAGAGEGRELILESYNEAIREGYRFFSYGDAMLIV